MRQLIDLTGTIRNGMWGYGHPFPEPLVQPLATVEQDGFAAHRMHLHSLTGTYLETAGHLYPDRELLGDVPLERCVLRAWVAQLPEKQELEAILPEELEAAVGGCLQPGDALLIATGWDRNWHRAGYTDRCPYFGEGTIDWIIDRGVSMLGVDVPSVQDPRSEGELSVLNAYYKENRLLLAPLVNLRAAEGAVPWQLVVLPLAIPELCASPCRAIVMRL
ncbi:cyclase family protein [Cohnella hashimotonis]|uniref:Cyclase family protein n=1 Tax=Cohnella hashimotonis TaxID=2826895 RepID=A0ABT6TFH4_9BACL|nr:cyclase family protein [Cohnella hashimotonis]MDI4645040.1 cyclase family protein [Cohnella hashimotonis]